MDGTSVSTDSGSLFYNLPTDLILYLTLSYFLNMFLNTSSRSLYFFNLQIVCSITIIFFVEWILLYSFSSWDRSCWFLFFLYGKAYRCCSGESFSTPRYPRSSTLTTCLGVTGWLLLYFQRYNHVFFLFYMRHYEGYNHDC